MLSSVIAPISRRVLAPDQEQRQRPALLARPPGPVDPVAERLAREMVGRPARLPVAQEGLAVAAQLRPGGVVAHLRQPQGQPLRLDRGQRGAAEAQHARPQAASRPASAARSGASLDRPEQRQRRVGRAPRAPRRRRAAARGVTASILATISSIVGHPAPDRQHPRQPLGPRRRALQPHQHPGLELRPRPVELGRRQAVRGAAQLVDRSARPARGSGRRRCRHRA